MIGDIFQPTHLLFILLVALLVLGPKRLPEVGRSLGRGIRDFRNALSTDEPPRHEGAISEVRAEPAPMSSEPVPMTPEPAPMTPEPAPVRREPAEPLS